MTQSLLRTARLVLEPISRSHAAKVFDALQDHRIYTFIPVDPPKTLGQLETRFEKLAQGSPDRKESWLNWMGRTADSEVYVGHFQVTIEGQLAILAYTVFPAHWRKGYAKESCLEILRYLREELGVKQFAALMDTRNEASIRLVESLGLRRAAMIPNADTVHGQPSDEYRYELP